MVITPLSPIKKAKFKHSTPCWRNCIAAKYSNNISAITIAIHKRVTPEHIRGVVKRFKL